MKIRVTKKLVSVLNKYVKGKPYKFEFVELSIDRYKIFVDYDLMKNERDFNFETGKFKAVKVSYDPGLYAMTAYLSTYDLNKFYVNGDSIDSYCQRVVNAVEV